jgi:hypothetical protein
MIEEVLYKESTVFVHGLARERGSALATRHEVRYEWTHVASTPPVLVGRQGGILGRISIKTKR